MVHYELVKITINAPELVEVILDIVIWHHCLPNFIVTDRSLRFTQNSGYYFVISLTSNKGS